MAKAQFHKSQRVFVKPVGTWALIERVVPHWAKGLDEPIRVHYDVSLGREFTADELQAEDRLPEGEQTDDGHWRVVRLRNKWQPEQDCARHPFPGTYPVVFTGDADWGGWRVPGAEYDLDPVKIERQARMIASVPTLVHLATGLVEWARKSGEDVPTALVELSKEAQGVLKGIIDNK